MPRYYFSIADGNSPVEPDGIELRDLAAARVEAVRLAGEMLKDHAEAFWHFGDWRLSVRDETGLILFSLTMFATEGAAFKPS